VCQDFSHIMIAVLRRLGLPSRYVSGYIAPAAPANPVRLRSRPMRGSRCACPNRGGWDSIPRTTSLPVSGTEDQRGRQMQQQQ
jgi:transglutaminase-like putative cysteine protease